MAPRRLQQLHMRQWMLLGHWRQETPPPRSQVPPSTSYMYSATSCLLWKLIEKIRSFEFVEMSEMLPEAWVQDYLNAMFTAQSMARKIPVTDILDSGVDRVLCTLGSSPG